VQDFESSPTDSYDLTLPRSMEDDPAPESDQSSARPPQREGLPPHYRMRAERHYVDSIASASSGVPIRLIPLAQFDPPPGPTPTGLDPLTKSIRLHGIVQPLIVRKRQTRYEVIAGRRRFAAAAALGLSDVPCVLHQVDDAAAAALRAAENIHSAPGEGSIRAAVGAHITDAIGRIAADLARLQTSLDALRAAPDGFERTAAGDLASAQAARTAWLANAAALLAGGRSRAGRRRLLSAILDEVVRQFEPECRLSGLRLHVSSSAPATTIDDAFVAVAVTGAVTLTLSLLEQVPQPLIEIAAQPLEDGGVGIHVIQRHQPLSLDVVERFGSRTRSAWTPMLFALGALALEHATAAHGGAADLVAVESTFVQPHVTPWAASAGSSHHRTAGRCRAADGANTTAPARTRRCWWPTATRTRGRPSRVTSADTASMSLRPPAPSRQQR
jgi:ParB-like chromosome segregation protein Spo0J